MACCIIGSLLFTLLVGVTRLVKAKLLGQQPERPELWRLSEESETQR